MTPTALVLLSAATASSAASVAPPSVVRVMFEAFNRHDTAALAALYAEDVRLASSDFCRVRTGRPAVVRTYRALFERSPGIHDEVQDVIVDGDRVAVRFVARSGQGARSLALPIATFLVSSWTKGSFDPTTVCSTRLAVLAGLDTTTTKKAVLSHRLLLPAWNSGGLFLLGETQPGIDDGVGVQ